MLHIPVLYQEVLDSLQPRSGGLYVDGTVGRGGHSAGILQQSAPDGRLLAFDRDPEALQTSQQRLSQNAQRTVFVHASYAQMGEIAPRYGFQQIDGILLDLGLSSNQLEDASRGFSFLRNGNLDMRFDPTQGITAADLINDLEEKALADLFWRYGEEPHSRKIAKAIISARPLHTTHELAELVVKTVGRKGRNHPATQLFQALRIAVNEELQQVEMGLRAGISLLRTGGRFVVISFHSLEDRLVKQTFRQWVQTCICPPDQPVCTCSAQAIARLISRKAIKPSDLEISQNPRSRSARLRVIEKL